MTDFVFPSGFIGAVPTPTRTSSILLNDGTNSGSATVSSVLALMIAADGSTAGFVTGSTVAGTYAPLASPSLTGTPIAPTASSGTNTTQIATTAFVKAQAYATLVSPTLTGTPVAPTASAGANTTQLATTAFVTGALASIPNTYDLLNSAGSAQWIKVGIFTAAQAGDHCRIQIISGSNFSANFNQHQISEIVFTTSNNSSVDGNGFAGSSTWHKRGQGTTNPTAVAWVSNAAGTAATTYTLYISVGTNTGTSSYYVVDVGTGTWANSNLGAQSNPGTASSTVCLSVEQLAVTSPLAFTGSTITIASPSLTGTPISTTATSSDNSTTIATTAFVKSQSYVTSSGLSATYAPIVNAALTGTLSIPSGTSVAGTGAFVLPSGTTVQQPDSGNVGEVRWNTTTSRYEFGVGGSWINHAKLNGDTFTGVVSGQTAATSDNSTKFATTAFVVANGFLVAATAATTYAPINNATFTGTHVIPSGSTVTGTGAFVLPSGTTGQQPDTGNLGEVRYNSTTSRYEFGAGGSWINHAKLNGDTFTAVMNGVTVTPGSDSTTKLATTAFVQSAVSLSGGYSPSAVVITGGSIDGTTLGATVTSSGAFTTLTLSSTLTVSAATASTLPFFNSSKQLVSGTLGSGLSFSGSALTLANPYVPTSIVVTGGTINSTSVGATTPAGGSFTALMVNSTITFSGLTATTLPVLNASSQLVSGTLGTGLSISGTTLSLTNPFSPASVIITGGSVNSTAVGNTTASSGSFTTLVASSTITLSGLTATSNLMLNSSNQLVSGTLGAGLAISGTALNFVPANVLVTPTSKSGAYTVLQTDNNQTIYTSDTSTVAYTLPVLTAGTTVEVIQNGTAKITWTASGTTVNCPVAGATGSRAQYSSMRFKWITSTLVIVAGDVA